MPDPVNSLTERERETLRLILSGHDAKSVARQLSLSVHTVNERLREARRKLGVSSSREAARLLAAHEAFDPKFLGDKEMGVAIKPAGPLHGGAMHEHVGKRRRAIWLAGGIAIMSLIIGSILLSLSGVGSTDQSSLSARPVAATDAPPVSQPRGLASALSWLGLLDRQRWDETWRTASTLFNSQISMTQWSSTIQATRQPLGRLTRRNFQSVTQAKTLPGAPAGDYEIITFRSDFRRKSNAVETVVLSREAGIWRVAGYFIR